MQTEALIKSQYTEYFSNKRYLKTFKKIEKFLFESLYILDIFFSLIGRFLCNHGDYVSEFF